MASDPCLCTAFRQAAHRVTQIYDRALAPAGLKVTMYRLMSIIAQQETPTITETAQRMNLDRSTLGRNVRVLERQGLVVLVPGADERTRTLALTPNGRTALAEARPLWSAAQREVRTRLGDAETDEILRRLGRIGGAEMDAPEA